MRHLTIATLTVGILAAGCLGCMTAFAAFQPENVGGETIVISTTGSDGKTPERVVSPIEVDGQLEHPHRGVETLRRGLAQIRAAAEVELIRVDAHGCGARRRLVAVERAGMG